jgi:hypothetical protein
MLRGSRNPELCRLFVEYALSEPGQRLLYQPAGTNGQRHALYRMPVVRARYADPDAPKPDPYDFPAGFTYDNDLGTRRWNILNDLMGVWLIDAHPDLRHAWSRIIALGCPADRLAELCAAPLSDNELNALLPRWKDPRYRQDVMQQWSHAARDRYRHGSR